MSAQCSFRCFAANSRTKAYNHSPLSLVAKCSGLPPSSPLTLPHVYVYNFAIYLQYYTILSTCTYMCRTSRWCFQSPLSLSLRLSSASVCVCVCVCPARKSSLWGCSNPCRSVCPFINLCSGAHRKRQKQNAKQQASANNTDK